MYDQTVDTERDVSDVQIYIFWYSVLLVQAPKEFKRGGENILPPPKNPPSFIMAPPPPSCRVFFSAFYHALDMREAFVFVAVILGLASAYAFGPGPVPLWLHLGELGVMLLALLPAALQACFIVFCPTLRHLSDMLK